MNTVADNVTGNATNNATDTKDENKSTKTKESPTFDDIIRYEQRGRELQSHAFFLIFGSIKKFILSSLFHSFTKK